MTETRSFRISLGHLFSKENFIMFIKQHESNAISSSYKWALKDNLNLITEN